jgi:probable HAF family extracellular repeat protein
VGGAGGAAGAAYTRTDLGPQSSAVAINALGQVLVNVGPLDRFCKPFVIDGNVVTEIVVAGEPRCTRAVAISDLGTVVGTAEFEDEEPIAFLWKDGESSALPVAEYGMPFMINNLEQLLLTGSDGTFLWDGDIIPLQVNGAPAQPYFLNNAGQVLARTASAAWLIEGTEATEIPLDRPQVLSDAGLVVGIHNQLVVTWNGTTVTELDVVTEGNPGQVGDDEDDDGKVEVRAVNPLGVFVGDYPIFNAEATRPFVFADGRTTRLAVGGSAVAINASGVVVGNRWSFLGGGSVLGDSIGETQWLGGAVWSRECFSSCCASE